MIELGEWLKDLGMSILPYSFAIYLPIRWLEYLWNQGYTRTVKAVWYIALGLTLLSSDDVKAETIVIFICFIEACDLFFQQLEIGRERNKGERKENNA